MCLYLFIPNRDIVDYVYRLIHSDNLMALNAEYKRKRTFNDFFQKQAGYVMSVYDYPDGVFMFNFRTDGNSSPIYNCKNNGCSNLSPNYHHVKLW